MGEPISTAAIFAFLNSCFKFAEYAVKIYGVESENGVFVRLIQQVQHDLNETERLLSVLEITRKVKGTPEKWRWIRETIAATKASLNEIGMCVESVRGEQEAYGSAKFKTKVKWIFKDHDKLVTRSKHLISAHQSLSTVLGFLIPLEDSTAQAPAPALEELPTYAQATYLSRRQRLMREQQLESSRRRDEAKDEDSSNKPTTTQHNLHPSSSMNDLAQTSTGFNHIPASTTAYAPFEWPAPDREEADSNGTNPFETQLSGTPTSARHVNIYEHPSEQLFSSSSLELPRTKPSYLTPRRSTESLAQNQRPSGWTTATNTPDELSPNQPSTHHSVRPVSQFNPWAESAASNTTTSPDEIVEMDGSVPVRPLSAFSTYPPVYTTESTNTREEQFRGPPSRNHDWTHTTEMPTDTGFANPSLAPEIPPKIKNDWYAERVEHPAPSITEELSSPTVSEAMQPYDLASTPEHAPSADHRPDGRSNSMPITFVSGSKPTQATEIKRKPTQKWVEARPANYDGLGYGNGVGEYHDEEAIRAVQVAESQEQIRQSIMHENRVHENRMQPPPRQWQGYERQGTYHAYGHQDTRPGPSNPRLPPPTIDITSPTPDITQHHRSFSDSEVAMPLPPIADQDIIPPYDDGYDAPLERTLTVGEMRRRRRKAMQAMTTRQSSI